MSNSSRSRHLGTVELCDGWRLQVHRGGAECSRPVALARALVREHYGRVYHAIAEYLAREDALMDEEHKVHFLLEDLEGKLQGHQLIYGDGPSPVPCETMQPMVDQRRGSRHVYEVKRAVLLSRGRYPQLLNGIASLVAHQYGGVDGVPDDHMIIGYSIEPAVARYLCDLGFSTQLTRGHESFIYYPTRDLIARYGGCPFVVVHQQAQSRHGRAPHDGADDEPRSSQRRSAAPRFA